MAIARNDKILEFSAANKEIAAITVWGGGYFSLHTLNDVWLWPWKYKKVRLNIDKIFLPQDTIYCVTDIDMYARDVLKVRSILGCDCFPTSIEVKSHGLLPVKINKGYPIAKVMFFPLVMPHIYNLDYPQESI